MDDLLLHTIPWNNLPTQICIEWEKPNAKKDVLYESIYVNILFLKLGIDYMDMFSLWKFIKLYIHDLCTFVYVC